MKTPRRLATVTLISLISVVGLRAETLPTRLTDQEFWKLSSESSESDGVFRSDNLLSNEAFFQYVLGDLTATAKTQEAYLGVGPEQNFTFMAALKPKIAFIIDIRRGNLDLHLMYKALFELSQDRAEFASRLFCRSRPDGLTTESTATEIFAALKTETRSTRLYTQNLEAIKTQLISKHAFSLSDGDLSGIEYVYDTFCKFGPEINYNSSSGGFGGSNRVNYGDLMMATDQNGLSRSYLATEENFIFLKDLETKNLVIPVVGNFGGEKAIRAVAGYLKDAGALVSAFYLSNVEQYLYMDGIWTDFCKNALTLPVSPESTFIRSVRGGRFGNGIGLNSDLGSMTRDLEPCTTRQ